LETTVVTHQSWRGQFARGTYGNGPRAGQLSDCDPAIGYPQQDCVPVQWPGFNTSAWHEGVAKPGTVGDDKDWMGSLAVDMRDATGQMYMRNRYYDPQTGQFTQPDPIGLAGGLNSYGFAAGDPVSYTDPYGLTVEFADWESERLYYSLKRQVYAHRNSDDPVVRDGASRLMRLLRELEQDDETLVLQIRTDEVTQTGQFADGSGRFGTWFNPNQDLDHKPELILLHELGHAYAFMRDGFYDDARSNRRALEVENYGRDMWGCRHRQMHRMGWSSRVNPSCE
jgi:RHS repeat-associated protein